MRIASALAGAAILFGMAAAATPSLAGPAVPNIPAANNLVTTVADWDGPRRDWGWRQRRYRWEGRRFRRCRGWRHECADRWGWGTWRFDRCMARHGC